VAPGGGAGLEAEPLEHVGEADLQAHARGQHAQRQVKRARCRLEQITQQFFLCVRHLLSD